MVAQAPPPRPQPRPSFAPAKDRPARERLEVRAVLETLAYSDVFDFPLTLEELWHALPVAASVEQVRETLDSCAVEAVDRRGERYFTLPGRGALVAVRERRRRTSGVLWKPARHYGSLIARLPFVRMVAVTGSLAVDNSDEGDDIDYLIVTRKGRVWLTRTMTMAIVRLAALRGLTLCPNYLLAEDALRLPDQGLYAARELVQMMPLSGFETYSRMLAENAWWRDILPNAAPAADPSRRGGGAWTTRLLEGLIPTALARLADDWILAHKGAELRAQVREGSEAAFDRSMCKGHFEGHRRRTEEAIAERLQRVEGVM